MASQEGGKGPLFGDSGSSGGKFVFFPGLKQKKIGKNWENMLVTKKFTTQGFLSFFSKKLPRKNIT